MEETQHCHRRRDLLIPIHRTATASWAAWRCAWAFRPQTTTPHLLKGKTAHLCNLPLPFSIPWIHFSLSACIQSRSIFCRVLYTVGMPPAPTGQICWQQQDFKESFIFKLSNLVVGMRIVMHQTLSNIK